MKVLEIKVINVLEWDGTIQKCIQGSEKWSEIGSISQMYLYGESWALNLQTQFKA